MLKHFASRSLDAIGSGVRRHLRAITLTASHSLPDDHRPASYTNPHHEGASNGHKTDKSQPICSLDLQIQSGFIGTRRDADLRLVPADMKSRARAFESVESEGMQARRGVATVER